MAGNDILQELVKTSGMFQDNDAEIEFLLYSAENPEEDQENIEIESNIIIQHVIQTTPKVVKPIKTPKIRTNGAKVDPKILAENKYIGTLVARYGLDQSFREKTFEDRQDLWKQIAAEFNQTTKQIIISD